MTDLCDKRQFSEEEGDSIAEEMWENIKNNPYMKQERKRYKDTRTEKEIWADFYKNGFQ